jgi:hypothetical protein
VVRPMSFLLGFWLAALFVAGQNMHMPQALVWLDGAGAAFAILGGLISPFAPRRLRLIGPVALSLGLFAVTFVAILMHVTVWFPFTTGIAAAIYLAVVLAEWIWSPRNRGTMAPADS